MTAAEFSGEPFGTLEVTRDGGFGTTERELLDRWAAQAAVAVHTVLLAREARRSRELVVMTREEERRRLRRDLHDGVGPSLAALALQVETARDLAADDPDAAAGLLSTLAPRINAVVADVRSLVHELRPPTLDELGLAGATRELAARLSGPARVDVEAEGLGSLPAAVEVAAYRIAGEAVTNAVRHSGAGAIRVRLCREADALVTARDLLRQDDEVGEVLVGVPGRVHARAFPVHDVESVDLRPEGLGQRVPRRGHAGEGELGNARTHEDHYEPELGDGALGEEELEVVLREGSPATDEHRDLGWERDTGRFGQHQQEDRPVSVTGDPVLHGVYQGFHGCRW